MNLPTVLAFHFKSNLNMTKIRLSTLLLPFYPVLASIRACSYGMLADLARLSMQRAYQTGQEHTGIPFVSATFYIFKHY